MVQTHLNVGVHFVSLYVNIIFQKLIFYYFAFTMFILLLNILLTQTKENCLHFEKNILK